VWDTTEIQVQMTKLIYGYQDSQVFACRRRFVRSRTTSETVR